MLQSRRLFALVFAFVDPGTPDHLTVSPRARLASLALVASVMLLASLTLLALLAFVASTAEAQGRAASGTPLHVAASRFEFVAAGDSQPPAKPLAVHNGGTALLTDVRVTRLSYADSSRGAAWLVAQPRQSTDAGARAPHAAARCGTAVTQ